MKRSIALCLALLSLLSLLSLSSCNKEKENDVGKTVVVGEESITFPKDVEHVTYAMPNDLECYFTAEDGTVYDLYEASRETLISLSQHTYEKKFPNLADKQNIADISASVFSELYSDKGIVYDGAELYIRTNPAAKCLLCSGKGTDGGYAVLAIDKTSGEIIMIGYNEP